MKHKVVVKGFDVNLNKILAGRIYDYRTKKYHNPVKAKGDACCIKAISGQLKGVHIENPIIPHYYFYVKDRRGDRDGIVSAFMKCFLDGLQKAKVIRNDGWNDVLTPQIEIMTVDKDNPRIIVILEEVERAK